MNLLELVEKRYRLTQVDFFSRPSRVAMPLEEGVFTKKIQKGRIGRPRISDKKCKNSGARIFYAATNPAFKTIRNLLKDEKQKLWAIGDELIRLKKLGFKLKKIAILFTQLPTRLSEIHRTAIAFPKNQRDMSDGTDFYHYELARKAYPEFGSSLNKSMIVLSLLLVISSRI